MAVKLPQPKGHSLGQLFSWAQNLVRVLTPLVGNSQSLGTPGTSSSGSSSSGVSSGDSYVPLTFAGTPLVFVTDVSGNLILVRFSGD